MKYVSLAIVVTILSATACKPNPDQVNYEYWGYIEGKDNNNCNCCTGYIIKIDTDPTPYHFLSFPNPVKMDTTVFPIKVILDYKRLEDCGNIHRIKIIDVQPLFRDPYAFPIN